MRRTHRHRRGARLRPPGSGAYDDLRVSTSCSAPSFDNETVIALEVAYWSDLLGAVDAIEMAHEVGLAIGALDQAVERTGEFLFGDRLHEIRRDDDDELSLAFNEVAAAKQGAE